MLSLPAPVRAYFDANASFDTVAMLAPFAYDAIVRDEQRAHRGLDEIRAWIKQATIDNQAIAVPQAVQSDGATHHVTAEVAGAFAGSPITLPFHFRLAGDCIVQLEIGQ